MGKFEDLVKSEEGMRSFWAKYKIPPTVGMRYAAQGEWVGTRRTGEVIIPMIVFIEGGMTIPIGAVTRNYLRFFRLSPLGQRSQWCAAYTAPKLGMKPLTELGLRLHLSRGRQRMCSTLLQFVSRILLPLKSK